MNAHYLTVHLHSGFQVSSTEEASELPLLVLFTVQSCRVHLKSCCHILCLSPIYSGLSGGPSFFCMGGSLHVFWRSSGIMHWQAGLCQRWRLCVLTYEQPWSSQLRPVGKDTSLTLKVYCKKIWEHVCESIWSFCVNSDFRKTGQVLMWNVMQACFMLLKLRVAYVSLPSSVLSSQW